MEAPRRSLDQACALQRGHVADPVEVARIRAYLEQPLTQYHWEVLWDKLIREGHDPEAV